MFYQYSLGVAINRLFYFSTIIGNLYNILRIILVQAIPVGEVNVSIFFFLLKDQLIIIFTDTISKSSRLVYIDDFNKKEWLPLKGMTFTKMKEFL